jgi:hypothetical protein
MLTNRGRIVAAGACSWRQWFAAWLALCLVTVACAADPRVALKRDVATAAAAWNRQNYPVFVQWLSPRVAHTAPQRAAALQEIKEGYTYLGTLGLKTVTVKPEEPQAIQRHGAVLTSVVPFMATIEGPSGSVSARSYLLAESRDAVHWRVLPLVRETDESVNRLFPEFRGAFRVPESSILSADPKLGALFGF